MHRTRRDADLLSGNSHPLDAVDGDAHAALAHVHHLGVVPVPVRRGLEQAVAWTTFRDALCYPPREGVFWLCGVEEEV